MSAASQRLTKRRAESGVKVEVPGAFERSPFFEVVDRNLVLVFMQDIDERYRKCLCEGKSQVGRSCREPWLKRLFV